MSFIKDITSSTRHSNNINRSCVISPPNCEINENIFKIIIPLLANCILRQNNETNSITRAYKAFLGDEGWTTPAFMTSAYLALNYVIFLNQKSDDQKISNLERFYIWLKKIPTNFATGASNLPKAMATSIITSIVAQLMFYSFGIKARKSDMSGLIGKKSLYETAVKTPFLEELFYREYVQGSLISTMKLINVVAFHMSKEEIVTDKNISTISRIFSAAIFGLAHSHQSLVQAVVAGARSYCFETWLYEKNGLFASFGLHYASNFFAFLINRAFPKSQGNNDF